MPKEPCLPDCGVIGLDQDPPTFPSIFLLHICIKHSCGKPYLSDFLFFCDMCVFMYVCVFYVIYIYIIKNQSETVDGKSDLLFSLK